MALFDCTCEATSGHARALSYETAHGTFQTPMFMPVGTSATVKGVTAGQLHDLNSQVVLANTYHLSLRPGADVVAEAGGVHRFMNYDGPMLTDSGGFQVFSLADTLKLDDDGLTFRSIYDGSKIRWTPESNMAVQEAAWRRYRHAARPMHALPGRARVRGEGRGPVGQLGASLPGRAHSAPTRRSSASCRAAWSWTCAWSPSAACGRSRTKAWLRAGGASAASASGATRWARTTR